MKTTNLNIKGLSILEVLISMGILGILMTAMTSFFLSQNREVKFLQENLARLDLETSLLKAFSAGGVCTFILSDATQSSSSSKPNRSVDVIDSTSEASIGATVISINRIPIAASSSVGDLVTVGDLASANSQSLKVSAMKFVNFRNVGVDQYVADFSVEFDQSLIVRRLKPLVLKNIGINTKTTDPSNAKSISECSSTRNTTPKMRRISFTDVGIHSWVVPAGVTSALVSVAGGGGSGMGWRISNAVRSGDSGGFVTSYPITLIPGETLSITVGKGGISFMPIKSGVLAAPGAPFYIFQPPIGDDGLGGYPGVSSKIESPSQGVLIECAGGSGASAKGIDNYSGVKVAGNLDGATYGSGNPSMPSSSRKAAGPYAVENGPGKCGPGDSQLGYGVSGQSFVTDASSRLTLTNLSGGRTGLGYGSGGDAGYSGCYVTATTIGVCITPSPGRDGAVFIDILY